MTRIRRVSDLSPRRRTPTCTKRSARRRQATEESLPWSTRLIRLTAVLVVTSVLLGIWNLRVDAVAVRGMCLVPRQQAASMAAPLVGERWLTASTSAVEHELAKMSWVESVHVRRNRLGHVEVSVREHQPLFRCADEADSVITCCGSKVAAPSGLAVDRLPVLEGLESESARLPEVLDCLHSQRWPFQRPLAVVRLNGRHGVEFVLGDGTEFWLGRHHLAQRLEWLLADTQAWRRSTVSHVDLRYDRQVVVAMATPTKGGRQR